jgi:hypothetical protein
MNHVFTKIGAGSSGRLARLAKHGVVACVLACTAAGAMAGWQDRSPRREEVPQMRERFDNRAQDSRYDRAYEAQMHEEARRRALEDQARFQQQPRDEGRRMRMTPDERSELKRQINEANRDLYPNARRR